MNGVICIHRYDSSTGTFTVAPGGEGFYYFSAYFHVTANEYALFDIQINGVVLCSAYGDRSKKLVMEDRQRVLLAPMPQKVCKLIVSNVLVLLHHNFYL